MSGPELIGEVLRRSTSAGSLLHGPAHWKRVALVARELAGRTAGADALVAFLFALFHDSMRLSDDHDPRHGERGALLAREMRGRWFSLSDEQMRLLALACEGHADGETSTDPTVGVCWDSDRLDLWRCGVWPNPALLSTPAARDPETAVWALSLRGQNVEWNETWT